MRRSKLYRYASDAVDHGRQYDAGIAIARQKRSAITALCGKSASMPPRAPRAKLTYSRVIEGLKAAKIELDRKILADLAATDAAAFTHLVKLAQDALKVKAKAKA